jgi:PAS domain S-box-containing protein
MSGSEPPASKPDSRTDIRLQESEAKFATAFHESPIPMVISSFAEAKLIEVNRAFERLSGYSATEVIGKTAIEIGLWSDPADRERWVNEFKEHGTVRAREQRFVTRAGKVFICNTTASVVMIGGQRCLLTAVEDVTEQQRMERALRESEERYRSFVENFSGIAYQGKDFVPYFFHGDVEGITGYTEDEFLAGRPKWNEIVYPDDREVFETTDERKLHEPGGHAYTREYRIVRKDGGIVWIQENIQSVCGESGAYQFVQGTIQDITERKQAERDLLASREALRALASELSAAEERERRRIASDLHDRLGQALAVLRMKFGALTATTDKKESAQLIDEIRDLLEKAVDDTSTLTFDLSPPILYELGVEAAIEWAGEQLCGEHHLVFQFSDDGRYKPLDEDAGPLLYRSARELMMNAVKHANASKLKVEIRRNGGLVTVLVVDDGVGFTPPENAEEAGSSGFGLYSIEERIQYLGGMFHIESMPDGGTRAMVSAPIKVSDAEGP